MSVRVNCPDCGDVSIENEAITLRPCVDDATRTVYNFRCPKCGRQVAKRCVPIVAGLIIGLSDVTIAPWFLPAELFEEHDGPPITVDDVIDFHEAISG